MAIRVKERHAFSQSGLVDDGVDGKEIQCKQINASVDHGHNSFGWQGIGDSGHQVVTDLIRGSADCTPGLLAKVQDVVGRHKAFGTW